MIVLSIDSNELGGAELGMLNNAPIEGIIQPYSQQIGPRVGQNLIFSPSDGYVSLDQLDTIEISLLINLIESMESAAKQLSMHLMSKDKLVLKPDTVFYNPHTRTFEFIYHPGKDNRFQEHLNFYRGLLIDSGIISGRRGLRLLNLLKSDCFTLEKLYDGLIKARPQKKSFFVSSKQRTQDPVETPPCLVEKKSPYHVHALTLKTTVIGSSDTCNIKIRSEGTIGEYVKIVKEENGHRLIEIQSPLAVKLNNEKIQGKPVLRNGDLIAIKDKEFIFIP